MQKQPAPSLRHPSAPRRRHLTLALAAACCAAPSSPARADTWTWTGGASGNLLWSASANWSHTSGSNPSAIPVSSQDTIVDFAGSLNTSPNQNIANPIFLNGLGFNSGAAAFTLSDEALEFSNSSTSVAPTIVQNSANNQTISNIILLNNNTTISGSGTGSLTFSSPIGGGGSLIDNYTGIVNLNASNSYTGGTTLNGAQLAFNNTNAFGTGSITFTSGTVIGTSTVLMNTIFKNSVGSAIGFQAASGTTLTVNPSSALFGSLNFGSSTNTGTVNFEPATFNYFGGTINVNGGTLLDGADALSQILSAYTVNITAFAVFNINGFNTTINNLTGTGTLNTGTTAGETFTLTSANFSGLIQGSGKLITTGNTVILGSQNSYSGGTQFGGGTIGFGHNSALSAAAISLTANTNLYAAGAAQTVPNNIALASAKSLTLQDDPNGAQALTLNGFITGSGALVMSGTSSLTLSHSNTYSGGTTINNGQVLINNANALGTGTITFAGGAVVATSTLSLLNSFQPNNAPINFQAAPGTTFTLGAADPFFGDLTFGSTTNTGIVNFAIGSESDSGGALNVNGGTLLDGSSILSQMLVDYATTIASGAKLDLNGNSSTFANLLGAGTLATGSTASETFTLAAANFSGNINGSGKLITTGNTVILSGSSSYTGGTTLGGGIVGDGNRNAFSTGAITLTANTNLYAANASHIIGNAISLNSGKTLTIQDDPNGAQNLTLNGAVSGSGTLAMSGTSTLTISTSNSYTGGTTLNSGQIVVSNNNALGTGTLKLVGGALTATTTVTIANALNEQSATSGITFQAAAGATLTLSGAADLRSFQDINFGSTSDTGTVNFTPSSIAIFGGAHLNVNGGTLLNGNGSLGPLFLGDGTTVAASATLDLNSNSAQIVILNGAGTVATGATLGVTLIVDSGNFSGAITGAATVSTGGFTDILSGSSSYTGGTTLAGGTLGVGNNSALSTGLVTLTANTNLYAQAADQTLPNNFSLNSGQTLTIQDDPNGPHYLALNGAISGSGSLAATGTGSLFLNNTNTYTGGTTVAPGAVLETGPSGTLPGNALVNGSLAFANSGTLTYPGNITGTGAFQTIGSGTLVLTGTVSATNSAGVGAGTLQIGNGGTTGSVAGNIDVQTNLAFNRADNITFAGAITGPSSATIRLIGRGSVTLTHSNTYAGAIVVTNGTLKLANSNAQASSASLSVGTSGAILAAAGIATSTPITVTPNTGLANTPALFTFETSQPTGPGPFPAESGNGSVIQSHSDANTTYSTGTGNGSPNSFISSNWNVNDYIQFSVPTTGFTGINLQWDQVGSATGPGNFMLEFSANGSIFANLGSYSVLTNASPNNWSTSTHITSTTINLNLGSLFALNNLPVAYFRLVDNSTTATNGTTVAPAGTERFDNFQITATPVAPNALLGASDTSGTATYSSTIALQANLSLTAPTGGTALFSNTISDSGSGYSVTKIGQGVVILSGSQNYTGGTIVNSGALVLGTTTSPGSKTFTLNHTAGDPGSKVVWVTGSPSTARLDLLASAINSTTFSAGQAIGYLTGAQYTAAHASSNFGGYTIAPADLLFQFTYAGDTNLDGTITAADYAQLDASFLLGHFNGTTNIASWTNGDFNYDGLINFNDYAAIDAGLLAYKGAGSPLAQQEISQHAAEFGAPYLAALQQDTTPIPTPEPTTLAILTLAFLLLPRSPKPSKHRR